MIMLWNFKVVEVGLNEIFLMKLEIFSKEPIFVCFFALGPEVHILDIHL